MLCGILPVSHDAKSELNAAKSTVTKKSPPTTPTAVCISTKATWPEGLASSLPL